jgi:hypothetical protein
VLELFTPSVSPPPTCDRAAVGPLAGPGPGMRRARRLTPDQEAATRAFGAPRSLRSLAAEFGVSRETVRAVIWG